MGFKTSGFPAFGFNPLGFRTSLGQLAYLIKHCGLSAYWNPLIDKVGKATRTAHLAKSFDGDGSMYIELPSSINLGKTHNIKITTVSNPILTEVYFGSSDDANDFLAFRSTATIRYRANGQQVDFAYIYDSSKKTYEIKRTSTSLELYVDGVFKETKTLAIDEDFIFESIYAYNGGTTVVNSATDLIEFVFNGLTYTLDNTTYDSTNQYIRLLGSDGTSIEGQINLPSATPVSDNYDAESIIDQQGGQVSKALGKNKFDEFDITTPVGGTVKIGNKYLSDVRGSNSVWFARLYALDVTETTISYLTDNNQEVKAAFSDDFLNTSADAITLTSGGSNLLSGDTLPNDDNKKWMYVTFRAAVAGVSGYVEDLQIEQGSVPTAYEPYQGLHYTNDGLNPIPQGVVVPADEIGKLYAFDSLGNRVTAESIGPIKKNFRVVDGVVDLKTQEIQDTSGTEHTSDIKEITVNTTGVATYRRSIIVNDSTNTLKTIKFKAQNLLGTDNPIIEAYSKSGLVFLGSMEALLDDTEYSFTFTPSDSGYELRFFGTAATGEIASKRYYDFILFEGTTEPTSGSWESGNSRILDQLYYLNDPTNILRNDADNVLQVYDDMNNIIDYTMYTSEDKQKSIWFDPALTQSSDCDHKARRFVDINEQYMVTVEGQPGVYEAYMVETFEGSGVYEQYWVLKEGVTTNGL